jgi:DNA modification methylase
VKSGEPRRPSAFDRLIESCIDDYQGKMSSRVIIGDMREITAEQIADGSIDAIVTDPPYDADGVPLFEALGAMAARVLKPGGSLLVLCGETYLPEYFAQLGQYLDYRWTMAVDLPGGQAVQQFDPKIIAFWKPVLWFTKGKPQDLEWCSDMIRTDPNSNDKTKHKWGQSEQLTRGMVEKCSHVGHVVLDPFLGGGTTGVICRQLQRKFIGIEIDPDLARAALKRIGEAKPGAG